MTHINAYYMNVDEKKDALAKAKADLQEAESLLKDHPDYKEPEEAKQEEAEESKPKKATQVSNKAS